MTPEHDHRAQARLLRFADAHHLCDLCALLSVPSVLSLVLVDVWDLLLGVPTKEKAPTGGRGALFYGDKSTRLVTALSSKKCVTHKLLKRRTLDCDKRRQSVVADNRNDELKR